MFNPLNNEHLVLGLYLPNGLGIETILVERNVTRRQRAGEGAKQSPTGRRDQVVQGAGVGLLHIGGDTVVFGDLVVDPKEDRLVFGR